MELGDLLPVQQFDEWDDDLMSDVCGRRLSKPVQALLITLSQIKNARDSFGADFMNKARVLDAIIPELETLRKACVDEWLDQ